MIRIVVTEMPEHPKDCPFSIYGYDRECYECKLKRGVNDTCDLEHTKECEHLVAPFNLPRTEEKMKAHNSTVCVSNRLEAGKKFIDCRHLCDMECPYKVY